MIINSGTAPKFIKRLNRALSNLEGKEFNLAPAMVENGIELTYNFSPASYSEVLVESVLRNLQKSDKTFIIKEPNGTRSFPDFRVKYANHFTYDFEVKSWVTNRRGWAAANVNKFNEALLNEDFKYFTTYYIDFNLEMVGIDRLRVNEVIIGRIWNFADGSKFTGSNPGFATSPKIFDTPEFFVGNAVKSSSIAQTILTNIIK